MSATCLSIDSNTVAVWHHGADRIRIIVTNDHLVDEDGARPGLQLAVSSNVLSADYNPASFNRLARAMRAAFGDDQGPADVPLGDRKIAARMRRLVNDALDMAAARTA